MADESKYPTRIAPYGLRMPPELKERVEAAAKANNRSMNAEIVATLEEKYPLRVFDAQELARFIHLLPMGDPARLQKHLDAVNASLKHQKLEMQMNDGEVIIRKS